MKQDSNGFDFDYSKLYQDSANQPPRQDTAQSNDDLQKNLEEQLRALGQTVTDSFQYGFDGLGTELSGKAVELGGTISEMVAKKISRRLSYARENLQKHDIDASNWDNAANSLFGFANFKPKGKEADATRELQRAARDCRAKGIVFTGIFTMMALGCGTTLIIAFLERDLVMFAVSAFFILVGGFGCMQGIENLRAYRFFSDIKKVAQGQAALSVDYLADGLRMPVKKMRKRLNKYLKRGWLSAWMDKSEEMLYFDLNAWREARDKRMQQTQEEPLEEESAQEKQPDDKLSESQMQLKNFIDALEKESNMMEDQPQAQQELKQLEQNSRVILEWITKHPESLPKIRHMTEQYIPTTLKLLYVYNDLKMHNSDNAANVRQDIAGMLHSLNLGIAALQDKLLDDVAMNVTGDIAALQGMLARDGLSADEMGEMLNFKP